MIEPFVAFDHCKAGSFEMQGKLILHISKMVTMVTFEGVENSKPQVENISFNIFCLMLSNWNFFHNDCLYVRSDLYTLK